MAVFNIFLIIFTASLSIFTVIFFATKWYLDNVFSRVSIPSSGTLFYYFDLQNHKVKEAKTSFFQKNILFPKWTSKSWVDIDLLIRKIEDEGIIFNKLKAVYENLAKGSNFEKINFTYSTLSRKNTYGFDVEFRSMEDYSNYIIKIRWKTLHIIGKTEEIVVSPLQKQQILNRTLHYKGFVAFNVKKNVDNSYKKLVTIIKQFWKYELTYFNASGFLILIFYANSDKKIKKKIEKFIASFKKRAYDQGAGLLFYGSAWAWSSQISTKKHWNSMIQALDFLIVNSIEKNISFVSQTAENTAELKKFITASKVFRQALKTEHIDFEYQPIKDFKKDKVISNFAIPKIKDISDRMTRKLLINEQNKYWLVDTAASIIGIEKKIKKSIFIDVNVSWLMLHAFELVYKKAIYVINYNHLNSTSELHETIRTLKHLGFIFALRINRYNEEISTLIKMIDPRFIIVSQSIRDDKTIFDSAVTINLMSLNQICAGQNIKIIFENPPKFIDEIMSEKIGLQYYY